ARSVSATARNLKDRAQPTRKDGRRERITSTLLDYGIPGGDTSVARTVALPAAIAARMILEGKINKPGIFIPVEPAIYEPILRELETVGIRFEEISSILPNQSRE
ncbi:MAG: hypothetical protein HY646_19590, partial [Acidobacteria bacterium]|nr:hypothetical protein [Acidobacteriota bacterium]